MYMQGNSRAMTPKWRSQIAATVALILVLTPSTAALGDDAAGKAWTAATDQGLAKERSGDLAGAATLLKKAADIAEKFPADDPMRLRSLENLGHVREMQGSYTIAESLYQKALALREKSFGADSPKIARAVNDLGRIKLLDGRYAEAEELLQRALRFRKAEDKDKDLPLAEIQHNLALLCSKNGKFKDADQYLFDSLAIRQAANAYQEQAQSMALGALLAASRGRVKEGEGQAESAIVMVNRKGKNSLLKADVLDMAAKVKLLAGKNKEALKHSESALAIRKKLLSAEHPAIAESLLTSGLIELANKDYKNAGKEFDKVLSTAGQSLTNRHPIVAQANFGKAFVELEQGKTSESREEFKKAVKVYKVAFGQDREVVNSYSDIFINRLGARFNLFETARERMMTPEAGSSDRLDVFGVLLTKSIGEERNASTLLFANWKDLVFIFGVLLFILILLAFIFLVPGSLSFLMPWRRRDERESAVEEKPMQVSPGAPRPDQSVTVWKQQMDNEIKRTGQLGAHKPTQQQTKKKNDEFWTE